MLKIPQNLFKRWTSWGSMIRSELHGPFQEPIIENENTWGFELNLVIGELANHNVGVRIPPFQPRTVASEILSVRG